MGAFFYKLASFLINRFPLKFNYWLANRLGEIYGLFARSSRRGIKSNLTRVFRGEIDKRKLNFCIIQTFREFSKYLVDFFFFSSLNAENVERLITIENVHYIDKALKDGKGIIVLTAHFGSWELGGVAMGLKGYPLNAVALDHRNRETNQFFLNQRKDKGEKVIRLGFAMRQCFEVLRKNEILALLGDRNFNYSEKGLKINFCDQETRGCIPKGAAKLALKTEAKIIPTFVVRGENNRSKLIFNEPLEMVNSGDKEKDIKKIMEDFFAVFEKFLKKYPAQWFSFRPLWEDTE